MFPREPLSGALDANPWNVPSTDSRKLWCWEKNWNGGTIDACDEEVKNPAARDAFLRLVAGAQPVEVLDPGEVVLEMAVSRLAKLGHVNAVVQRVLAQSFQHPEPALAR